MHCLIVGDADFAFGQQFLERSDVLKLFTDVDTPTKQLQVLSLKMACTVAGGAAQASMEARDGVMLAELAAVRAFATAGEHPRRLLDRYYERMPSSGDVLLAKALLAAVLWRTRRTEAAEEAAAAAAAVAAQRLLADTWCARTRVGRSPFTSSVSLADVGLRVPMRFNLNPAFATHVIAFAGDTIVGGARYHSQAGKGDSARDLALRQSRAIGRTFDELREFCNIVGLPLEAFGETAETWVPDTKNKNPRHLMSDKVGRLIKLCLVRRQGRCACMSCARDRQPDDLGDWRGATCADLHKLDFAHRDSTPKPRGNNTNTWQPVMRAETPFQSLRTGWEDMILYCELAHRSCHREYDKGSEAMYGENILTRGARVPIVAEVDDAFAAVPHWRTDPSWRASWGRGIS